MPRLTCGAAVITYNGLKYLPQQLDSIVAQNRPVDHIVIADDGSTDGTLAFLETWIKQCAIPVTLIHSQGQRGLVQNFERAVSAVNADLIFSSDQDDVWLPHKVELMAVLFEAQPELLLAHTDAILVDAQGRDMGTTLFGELEVTPAERQAIRSGDAFSVFCRRNLVTGATAAFRKSLLQLAQPLPTSTLHDTWLGLMAAATGKVQLVDRPTIQYRQHGSNVVGVKKLGRLTRLRHLYWEMRNPRPLSALVNAIVTFRSDVYTRLSNSTQAARSCTATAKQALDFAEDRGRLPGNPVLRTGAVLRNMAARRYRRFSYEPWSDMVRDILNK